ncbi:hypothetical protein F5Y10DRAFT_231879 [Nemania abortiva]|nr:hypothetical protein F5Y10DRAFT_231879 [Nemania abortiva]
MPRRNSNEMFDLGASEAMPNTEFSSGIFEAPELSAGSDQNTGRTGGAGKTPGKTKEIEPDPSISKKPKDTAGAGAMIL